MLKTLWLIFYTELILLLRRSQEWLYPLGFFTIVVCLFPLAFTPDPQFLKQYVPGCIWMAALLASLLSLERIFYTDLKEGSLEQLLLSPTPLTLLLSTKLFAHWIATELPLIILTPLLGWMFHLDSFSTLVLCLSLFLGTPILTLLGSMVVALTLELRQQGVLLGLLLLPLVVPVLIFGVNLVQQAQAGLSITGSLAFLSGLTIFAVTILPWGVAATLRVSLDG